MPGEYRHSVDAGLGGISSVVATLPAGYTLGEARYEGNIKYRLFFNSGGEQIGPGFCFTPVITTGPYSVTITTTSKTFDHIGAGFIQHATSTTATFFWGAVRGRIAGAVGDASSTPTGSVFYIGSDGKVELHTQSVITGSKAIGVNLGGSASKTITTGAKSGDPYVNLE